MNIGIVGSGYVGLVTAACLSEMCNNFYCFDKNYGYVRLYDKNRWGYSDRWFRTKKEARLSIEERGLSWIEV